MEHSSINERNRSLRVRVSSFNSIHNFIVVRDEYLRWLPAIQQEITSDETIAQAKKLKPHNPKIGDRILTAKDNQYSRANIIDLFVFDKVLFVHVRSSH